MSSPVRDIGLARSPWLVHPGDAAAVLRERDWSATALGPLDRWPDSLCAAVSTMLAQALPISMWVGPQGLLLYNDAYAQIFSSKHPWAMGQSCVEVYKEAADKLRELLGSVLSGGSVMNVDDCLRIDSGEAGVIERYFTYSIAPVWDARGNVIAAMCITQETTQRVLTERAAAELETARLRAEERMQYALSASEGVGLWEWDVAANRVFADECCARIFGHTEQEGADGVPLDLWLKDVHPADMPALETEIARVFAHGGNFRAEYRVGKPDKAELWVSVTGFCTLDDRGMPVRFAGATVDVTDRRRAEHAIRQTEKLAAVGRLATSIAHEINNPLESVMNLVYLSRQESEPAKIANYLEAADQELQRVAVIANQTLRFYRQPTEPRAVTCGELFRDTIALYNARLDMEGIAVQRRSRAQRSIVCYEGEIRQVLSNLVSNAIDAMQPGGTLHVRSREGRDWQSGARGLVLTVADTGSGMPQDVKDRVCDAFFTTKGEKGTGLGMWVSRGIVDRHSGRMRVRSSTKPGASGTVWNVFLPFDTVPLPDGQRD